jgi:predicted lipoprotein with Yx(FWY)xxD motif
MHQKKSQVMLVFNLFVIASFLLTACASQAGSAPAVAPTAMPPATAVMAATAAPTTAPAPVKLTLNVGKSDLLGSFLVDSNGRSLYIFVPDTNNTSTCYDKCAQAWPPMIGSGVAGDGVDASMIGSTTRKDGTTQITYNGHPLYYWFKDAKAGDVTGQGVGNVWFVINPTGNLDVAGAKPMLTLVKNDTLGSFLGDDSGKSLYVFSKDSGTDSACYDKCAVAWPPLYGTAKAGDGVDASMLGTITRKDGTTQVTYNGHPLYFWFKDAKAGDVNGQGVGDVWFVLNAGGNPVTTGVTATLKAGKSDTLGDYITDANGNSLYIFTKDNGTDSACYGKCAANWPPLYGMGKAGDGIDASKLGTITRKDGTTQITYNGHPLYYWSKDTKAGDVTGQGIGDIWFALNPSGSLITTGVTPAVKLGKNDTLGSYLTDGNGNSLYIFLMDTSNKSACSDACAANWPPLYGSAKPADGLDAAKFGTLMRPDGTMQVTFNGHPLYLWSKDAKPGDVTGQGIKNVWYVVSPLGEAVKAMLAPVATPQP